VPANPYSDIPNSNGQWLIAKQYRKLGKVQKRNFKKKLIFVAQASQRHPSDILRDDAILLDDLNLF